MSAPEHITQDKFVEINWTKWLLDHGLGKLFSIKVGHAQPFDQVIWKPGDADRKSAWQLYSELRTRIATQPLSYRSGDEESALESIYRLFGLTRSIIKKHEGCTHFAALAVQVLNAQIRPFTAKWHRKKVDGQLSSTDVRFDFRRELAELQSALRHFMYVLGELAQDASLIPETDTQLLASRTDAPARLWEPVVFGIDPNTSSASNTSEITAKESEEILKRRAFYGFANADKSTDGVGLAISGGGIRSATFALGVVQVLARKGILQQVDYLSTVSGGGYLGAFISSFLNDNESERVNLKPDSEALPFGGEHAAESQSVRHLRNHSKYLSEGGFKTLVTIAGLVSYGVLVSVLLVSPLLLASVLITKVFWGASFKNAPSASFTLSTTTLVALCVLAFAVMFLPIPQNAGRNSRLQRWWERGCIGLTLVCAILLACETLPHLFHVIEGFSFEGMHGTSIALGFAAVFSLVLGALGLWLGTGSLGGQVVFGLFGLAGPILILAAFLWLCGRFISPAWSDSAYWLVGLTLGSLFYSSFVLNINFASPHRFYRDRLARTYLTRSKNGADAVASNDPQRLSAMNLGNKSPYHLINAALNIPSCEDPNLRGRNTDFFLFSKHFCGSPIIGFRPTVEWEAMDSHLNLGTSVAISGAAAAPHMGTLTSSRFAFLLAMLNVRLGYWARRPREKPWWIEKFLPPVGWYYFLRELTGVMTEKTDYLNLSDGGHIENLGIYELLRRRCKFVIAIDGEADPKRSFGGLLKLTQLAAIDLGVHIEPDLSDLRMDRDGHGRAHFGLSRIEYRDGQFGLLLYIKSSLTGNESEFLKKYRAENPAFPHQSTAQQLFSETQFEAYRSLGEHIASDLFRIDLVGTWTCDLPISEFFNRVAVNLF